MDQQKKIGASNPCLISLDPLIQTALLSKVLVGDDLVKKRLFMHHCCEHMTTQPGKAKLQNIMHGTIASSLINILGKRMMHMSMDQSWDMRLEW